ncbi:MAG: hypothetical protein F4124_12315 [Acidimicrobiia bacterium]|nr:hypothetical protein [Acidimicrobiia bacterium]MYB74433.1 hypothetical protein [Acidimicrobiia bacterium]MYI00201.1 hypothetical protein [Acidimicrobiia bacterium]
MPADRRLFALPSYQRNWGLQRPNEKFPFRSSCLASAHSSDSLKAMTAVDRPADQAPKPRPYPERDSAPWWERINQHRFELQRCDGCGAWRWPPRAMCGRCASFEYAWTPLSGRATVESWVVNHHAFLPGFASPYTVVLGRLDEQDDLCLPATWQGGDEPVAGQPIEVAFEDHVDDEGPFTLLAWRPV